MLSSLCFIYLFILSEIPEYIYEKQVNNKNCQWLNLIGYLKIRIIIYV